MDAKRLQQLIAAGVPNCREPQLWAPALAAAFEKFGLTEPEHILVFLAQAAHESGSLNRVAEDLNYTAARLIAVWPKRFPDLKTANEYAGQSEKLANFVYGGRFGNTLPGDGFKYRGRGIFGITFKDNYAAAERALALPLVKAPQLLQDKPVSATAAAHYWSSHKIGEVASDFEAATRRINTAAEGLDQRLAHYRRLQASWASLQS